MKVLNVILLAAIAVGLVFGAKAMSPVEKKAVEAAVVEEPVEAEEVIVEETTAELPVEFKPLPNVLRFAFPIEEVNKLNELGITNGAPGTPYALVITESKKVTVDGKDWAFVGLRLAEIRAEEPEVEDESIDKKE